MINVPQITAYLDDSKYYAVCYAENDGSVVDITWADSHLRIKMSKVESVASHHVTHYTTGQLAEVTNLEISYTGSLDEGKWLSLIDSTLNTGYPCAAGAVAAAGAELLRRGQQQYQQRRPQQCRQRWQRGRASGLLHGHSRGRGGHSFTWALCP